MRYAVRSYSANNILSLVLVTVIRFNRPQNLTIGTTYPASNVECAWIICRCCFLSLTYFASSDKIAQSYSDTPPPPQHTHTHALSLYWTRKLGRSRITSDSHTDMSNPKGNIALKTHKNYSNFKNVGTPKARHFSTDHVVHGYLNSGKCQARGGGVRFGEWERKAA